MEGDQCDDEVAIKQAAAATVKRLSTKRNKKFKEGKNKNKNKKQNKQF